MLFGFFFFWFLLLSHLCVYEYFYFVKSFTKQKGTTQWKNTYLEKDEQIEK